MAGFDLDAWLDEGVVRSAEARVCLRADLIADHVAAEVELGQAKPADRRRLAQRVQELEDQIEATTRTFRFESVSARAWADMRRANLPTASQLVHEPELDHNPDTFPLAAIAASCADPELTYQQVEQIRASPKVDAGEWQKLWEACLHANLEVAMPPKSLLATAVLSRNGASSTTAAPAGSPEASS